MSDGINLTGFNETKPGATNDIYLDVSLSEGTAFPATDMSTQDGSGLGQNGK